MSLTTNESEISLFHYEPGYSFVLQGEEQTEEEQGQLYQDMVKLYEKKKFGVHEMCLFRTLAVYGCLNKYMLTKVFNQFGYIPEEIKKPDYSNLLARLRKERMIICHCLSGKEMDKTRTLYVYTLSPAVKRLLLEKEKRESVPCDMEDTACVLERLSLNQCAIAAKAEKKGRCYLPYTVEGIQKKMQFPFAVKGTHMTLLFYVCKKKEEEIDGMIRDMVN